ncbi:hypothetical protein N7490_008087 [Penicillium lividum]|nr:hypothetical protein N7490_008087 [Penicillium lividum]
MAEPDSLPRRSSSLASSGSSRSQRARALRPQAHKRHSTSSNITTDLTSFPSLSPPDRTPTLTRGLTNTLMEGDDGDKPQDTGRGRKATLAKLTTGVSHAGRAALFDDSVPTHDIPGALHLADDAPIERLIANIGAVKIVRQFARDLAQRDAEISALRQRADARERELKRMLREVSVSNQDIERRLYQSENSLDDRTSDGESSHSGDQSSQQSSGLNGLMSQAMTDAVGSQVDEATPMPSEYQATIRAQRSESEARSNEQGPNRKRQGSLRGWQEYLFGSTNPSRNTSRASSIMGDMIEVDEENNTGGFRAPSNPTLRRKGLDDQLFQPPGSAVSDATGKRIVSASTNGDDASIHSRKSSRSIGSWTVKLFAGNSQAKDNSDSEGSRTKPPSEQNVPFAHSKGGMTAVAALKRINSNTNVPSVRSTGGVNGISKLTPPNARRSVASGTVSQSATPDGAGNSTNLGPVEMDAILPMESRPPTLAPIYNKSQSGEFLTDRFGFIYDQRRKRRQREATTAKPTKPTLSIAETLGNLRSDSSDEDDDLGNRKSESIKTPTSPTFSPDDPEGGSVGLRRWQDYLKIPSRPTELLSHTPSAAPIVSLTDAAEGRLHSASVSTDKGLSVNPSPQPSASTSAVTADRPEFAGTVSNDPATLSMSRAGPAETEPVKLLLEQLTDLHDTLQRDRTVRWNEFLRKVRAERRKEGEAAAAASSDRTVTTVDTPEATLTDGEVVGIAGLGNKGKVGRAKWREFRMLVLGGIPVALRAKVWSECSGASAMRIPGYYDDLVRGVGGLSQTRPGVAKLKEVLLAYSRRNAEVGYCQGMNLIAASLLLIMPTAEDAFWILVSMIEIILPQHYYDHGLLASRADQVVLRQYISELLPKLSAHLENLGIELEALTFQWFLSVFTDCLSAEALYRVWDVVLCLNVTSSFTPNGVKDGNEKAAPTPEELASGSGGGSTFLFQVALALLKLNEPQLLTTCSTPAALYTYINHQMTNHAISIDGLIQASEALRNMVRREEVVARRAIALHEMRGSN